MWKKFISSVFGMKNVTSGSCSSLQGSGFGQQAQCKGALKSILLCPLKGGAALPTQKTCLMTEAAVFEDGNLAEKG